MSRKLTDSQWWNEPAPEKLIAALSLPAGTSRATAVDHALARIGSAPVDSDDERLGAILLHLEVYLDEAQREYLRSIGLLRLAPARGEFRLQTPEQIAADERVTQEIYRKLGVGERTPEDERFARLVAELAVRARATANELAELDRRGLLPADFRVAAGPVQ